MHSLRTISTVIRFRAAALLFCGNVLLRVAAFGLAVPALLTYDRDYLTYALVALCSTIVVTIVLWMLNSRTNCPLCMTPVMALKDCAKHGRAKTAFGSHRLRVALSILFKNSFVCPYCIEATAVRTRERQAVRSVR